MLWIMRLNRWCRPQAALCVYLFVYLYGYNATNAIRRKPMAWLYQTAQNEDKTQEAFCSFAPYIPHPWPDWLSGTPPATSSRIPKKRGAETPLSRNHFGFCLSSRRKPESRSLKPFGFDPVLSFQTDVRNLPLPHSVLPLDFSLRSK